MLSEKSTAFSSDPAIRKNASLISQAAGIKALHPWRPRDGQCEDYELFKDSLIDNLIALDLDPDIVKWEVPSVAQIRKSQPSLKEPQLSEMLVSATLEFQAQGTAIFTMVKPALVLDGVHQSEDLEEIRALTRGKVRDGRGLLEWAEQWCDYSTFDAQTNIRNRMAAIKFINDMTLAQFHVTSRSLWKLWCQILTNSSLNPTSFWLMYLHLMPSMPPTSHMAQLRAELAKDVMKNTPLLSQPLLVFKQLEKLGEAFGMPKGDTRNLREGGRLGLGRMMAIGMETETTTDESTDKSDVKEDNGCTVCDVPCCLSGVFGGDVECICYPVEDTLEAWTDLSSFRRKVPAKDIEMIKATRQFLMENQADSAKGMITL